jgi:hypothetical protein
MYIGFDEFIEPLLFTQRQHLSAIFAPGYRQTIAVM